MGRLRYVSATGGAIVTVVTVLAGGLAANGQEPPDQEKAVAVVKRLGGRVEYDKKAPGQPVMEVSFLGADKKPTDADIEGLKPLKKLRRLWIIDAEGITDAALEHITGFTELEELGLAATRITDKGLAHLKGMANLRRLEIKRTKVGDAGLAHLAGLKRLEHLDLIGTKVSDDGLRHLEGVTELRQLCLSHTTISDDGLAHLAGLTKLETLRLNSCPAITDKAAPHLKKLTSLKLLEVVGTRIDRFHLQLPKVEVIYGR
jgi:hypothetical protein